jgi:hypothetical protein
MNLAPNTYRPGVIAGFALGMAVGLTPTLSIGLLFAQGVIWQPATPPAVPALPALSGVRYLAYNSTSGLYWALVPNGDTDGDAVLGWAETNSTTLVAVSNQVINPAAAGSSFSGSSDAGNVSVPISGTAASIDCQEIPTGTLDGSNVLFDLVSMPIVNSLSLALNGVLQALSVDFTLTGNAITYTVAPKATDWHRAWYQTAA